MAGVEKQVGLLDDLFLYLLHADGLGKLLSSKEESLVSRDSSLSIMLAKFVCFTGWSILSD